MRAIDGGAVIGEACAMWAQGRLKKLQSLFLEDAVFAVPSCPQAASFVGDGLGRALFGQRLEMLLEEIEVLTFDPISLSTDGIWHYNRVRYRYRHHASRLIIGGTMRQRFGLVGNRIAHFELFHDTRRMRAFYDFAAHAACDA
jgi:hypothetical protein